MEVADAVPEGLDDDELVPLPEDVPLGDGLRLLVDVALGVPDVDPDFEPEEVPLGDALPDEVELALGVVDDVAETVAVIVMAGEGSNTRARESGVY